MLKLIIVPVLQCDLSLKFFDHLLCIIIIIIIIQHKPCETD